MPGRPQATTNSGWQRLAVTLASACGIGYMPIAPGTFGSLAGLGLYLLLPASGVQVALIAGCIVMAIWSAGVASSQSGKDPSYVVIDEVAGMLVACMFLPKSPLQLGAAFLLFRLFDIGKWFPMKPLERLPGGWGIVADDLAAGLLTRLLLLFWPSR